MRARRSIVLVFVVAACNSVPDSVNEPEPEPGVEPVGEVSQALPKPPRCKAGFAECNNNTKQGDRCETNTSTSADNCGGCGNVCSFANAGATCAGGVCQMGACNVGFLDCDNNHATGCEADINTDEQNCGSCGAVCSDAANASEVCSGGTCTIASCDSGFADCDGNYANGCETNTSSDLQNCGACGNACGQVSNATETCSGGACAIASCDSGFGNCDGAYATGCEANLNAPPHCGTCFLSCPFGQVCCPNTHPTTGGGTCQLACT